MAGEHGQGKADQDKAADLTKQAETAGGFATTHGVEILKVGNREDILSSARAAEQKLANLPSVSLARPRRSLGSFTP